MIKIQKTPVRYQIKHIIFIQSFFQYSIYIFSLYLFNFLVLFIHNHLCHFIPCHSINDRAVLAYGFYLVQMVLNAWFKWNELASFQRGSHLLSLICPCWRGKYFSSVSPQDEQFCAARTEMLTQRVLFANVVSICLLVVLLQGLISIQIVY